MDTTPETIAAFNQIMESSIFRTDGEDIDLCDALTKLCEAVEAEPDYSEWYNIGEGLECDCASLLIGAYWSLAEWHGGQASPEYATHCAIGGIYTPNMANGPEPGSSEATAYELINQYFQAANATPHPQQ